MTVGGIRTVWSSLVSSSARGGSLRVERPSRRTPARRIAPSLAALVLVAGVARGQEPPSFADRVTVDLVNVDLHVTDRAGKPVAGVRRDELRLLVDGHPVEISHFDWRPPAGAAGPEPGGAAEEAAARERLHLGIFLDELQIGEHDRRPLLEAVERTVSPALRRGDRATVVRFDGADLEVLLEWSDDRGRLRQALEELRTPSPRRLLQGHELRQWIDTVRHSVEGAALCNNTGEYLKMFGDFVRGQADASASALVRFAQRLGSESGKRVLMHLSDGLPMVAGGELHHWAREMCDGTAMRQGIPSAVDVAVDIPEGSETRDRWDAAKGSLEALSYNLVGLWSDVAALTNALGVTLYTVQAGEYSSRFLPYVSGERMTSEALFVARENTRETLVFLAETTGGRFLDATVGQASLDRVARDLGGYYSLAFTPPAIGAPGVRQIRIELDRKGVDLRHRRSYRLESPEERVIARLVELWDADRVANPAGIALRLAPAAAGPGSRLVVSVPLAGVTLLDLQELGRSGKVKLFLVLRDRQGNLGRVRERQLPITVRDGAPPAYTYEVELPEDAGEIAVAVFDELSGEASFARLMGR